MHNVRCFANYKQHKMRKLIILICTLIMSNFAFAQNSISAMMTTNINGKLRNLTDYVAPEGHTVFVFWKTCCPNNLAMLSNLIDAMDDAPGVKFVLVAVDDARSASRIKPIIGSYGWDRDVILDTNQEFARKANAMTTPQWVVVNSNKEEVMRCKITSSQTDIEIYLEKIKNLN